MPYKVVQVLQMPVMLDYERLLRQKGVESAFVAIPCTTEKEIVAAAHQADFVIGNASVQRFSRAVIEGLRQCRMIVSLGIGYENLDLDAATENGILAVNVPDFCLEEVSDHCMALILACTRQVITLDGAAKAGGWSAKSYREFQRSLWPRLSRLRGQTLGLVGFGRIPRSVAARAKGFGMEMIGYDPYVDSSVFESLGVHKVELDYLLAHSDIVSLHCALNSETLRLMNSERLRLMKPTAYLVNTGRGGLVDQTALLAALRDGRLTGAALDVMDPEPPDPDDPLLHMQNVIVTAHSAGISPTSMQELVHRPVEEIARVAGGEWPVGLVNHGVKSRYQQKWRNVQSA